MTPPDPLAIRWSDAGHRRSLHFPHAITAGDRTTAISRALPAMLGPCYWSDGRLRHHDGTGALTTMTATEVRVGTQAASVIWDSAVGDPGLLRATLATGVALSAWFIDDEGIGNLHPLDLLNLDDDGGFTARTELVPYLDILREAVPPLRGGIYPAWYCLAHDGTYYNFYDLTRRTVKRYGRLRLLA